MTEDSGRWADEKILECWDAGLRPGGASTPEGMLEWKSMEYREEGEEGGQ